MILVRLLLRFLIFNRLTPILPYALQLHTQVQNLHPEWKLMNIAFCD